MIIYGAGGHARVVYDCLRSAGVEIKGVLDDDHRKELFEGLIVHHLYSSEYLKEEKMILAIGSNEFRAKVSERVKHEPGKCIDPSSQISTTATIEEGAMIMPWAIIQAAAKIGRHVIVNTGAIVEHDCAIGDFAHAGPGSVMSGGVQVGEGVLIGANATILPGIKLGAWSTIGAGAVVVDDVDPGHTVAGNPARIIKT